MQRKSKTALVVEGGGLRGAFAVGVLRVLLDRLGPNYFDGVYAVSSGVFAATYYVAGQGDEMEATWRQRVSGNQLIDYWGVFTGKPILRLDYLVDLFKGPVRLDLEAVMRSTSSLEYVLTDYATGRPVYFDAKRPDLFDLMRASSALPRVYPLPVTVDGHPYYDGGQSDAIPIQRAIDAGARRIVVIRTRHADYVKTPRSRRMANWLLPRAQVVRDEWLRLHERYNATLETIRRPPAGVEVLSFSPPPLQLGRLSRDQVAISAAIDAGKIVANERLGELSKLLSID